MQLQPTTTHRTMIDIAIDIGTRYAHTSVRTILKHARAAVRATGCDPYPVGIGNAKVGGPSTYRGIVDTCPPSCPLYVACYATEGNVNIHQRNAGSDVDRSLGAIAIGLALVVAGKARAVRLHTSGDFGSGSDKETPDLAYVRGVAALCGAIASQCDLDTVAWTYTHLRASTARDTMIATLRRAGVEVLISDHVGAGGAIVMPHDKIADLRSALRADGVNATPIACPEQAAAKRGRSVSCMQCGLCFEATSKKRLIVFDPIGGEARKSQQDKWTPAAPLAHYIGRVS